MKMKLKLIGILGVAAGLAGCSTTNYNDVMRQWVESQERVAAIQSEAQVAVALAQAQQAQALAGADMGGVSWTDPATGQVLSYRNPNLYFVGSGSGAGSGGVVKDSLTARGVILPPKPPDILERTAAFVGNFAQTVAPLALQAWGITESGRTARWVARENTRALLGKAEWDYRRESDMFGTFEGFGDNMAGVAQAATGDMRVLGESAVGQMYLLGRSGYEAMAKNNGHAFAAVRDVAVEAFRNPLTNTLITNEVTEVPEWVWQAPIIQIGGGDE